MLEEIFVNPAIFQSRVWMCIFRAQITVYIHAQMRAQITVYIHCADYSICTYTENTCSIPTHVEVIYNIIHFVHDNGGKSGSFTNKETFELNLYFVVL